MHELGEIKKKTVQDLERFSELQVKREEKQSELKSFNYLAINVFVVDFLTGEHFR